MEFLTVNEYCDHKGLDGPIRGAFIHFAFDLRATRTPMVLEEWERIYQLFSPAEKPA